MSRPAFIFSPHYEMDIGKHVFPTAKFRLIKEALLASGRIEESEIEESPLATRAELRLVLDEEYVRDLEAGRHTPRTLRSELPITSQIVRGCTYTAGGGILAVRRALERGGACHLGGGFHHGYPDHAEGFCYINDVAIAAAWALEHGGCRRVAVVDSDVHQGNGTAAAFRGRRDVFTFSIHQEDLYPYQKETSDLDIGLPRGTGDEEYLAILAQAMDTVLSHGRPDLILCVAGADPFEDDQLGSIRLSFAGMKERDRICLEPAVRLGIPFVTVTGGGYARRLADTVALHVQTVEVAIDLMSMGPVWEPGNEPKRVMEGS